MCYLQLAAWKIVKMCTGHLSNLLWRLVLRDLHCKNNVIYDKWLVQEWKYWQGSSKVNSLCWINLVENFSIHTSPSFHVSFTHIWSPLVESCALFVEDLQRFEFKGEICHIWGWTNIGDRGKFKLDEDRKEDIDTAARNYSLSFNRSLGKKEVEKRNNDDNSHLRRHVAISNWRRINYRGDKWRLWKTHCICRRCTDKWGLWKIRSSCWSCTERRHGHICHCIVWSSVESALGAKCPRTSCHVHTDIRNRLSSKFQIEVVIWKVYE